MAGKRPGRGVSLDVLSNVGQTLEKFSTFSTFEIPIICMDVHVFVQRILGDERFLTVLAFVGTNTCEIKQIMFLMFTAQTYVQYKKVLIKSTFVVSDLFVLGGPSPTQFIYYLTNREFLHSYK